MSAALLPCPFCGSPAAALKSFDESLYSHEIVTWYEIRCSNSDGFDDLQLDCPGSEGIYSEDIDDLAAAWNRRAAPLFTPDEVARIDGWLELAEQRDEETAAIMDKVHALTLPGAARGGQER